jgi:phospholipid-binding lipoprotein MlaA
MWKESWMKLIDQRAVGRFLIAGAFLAASGSATLPQLAQAEDNPTDAVAEVIEATAIAAPAIELAANNDMAVADAAIGAAASAPAEDFDQDPWEGFNEPMFNFNREILDRFIIKPLATGWDFILPDLVQRGFRNMFDNLDVVRRVVNNSLQLKLNGAATELARFTINSTVGLAGFFDVAKDALGLEQKDEDTGQTFGMWGVGPGPYLVLPFLPPMSVRDGIGFAFDSAMFPPSYFIPFWATIAGTATEAVNERSLNLDRFERVAESTVDLYSAVRNAYLQRRAAAIRQ